MKLRCELTIYESPVLEKGILDWPVTGILSMFLDNAGTNHIDSSEKKATLGF